ncbi:hypothetical protein SEA_LIFES_100 [Microbacterium phage Lifes]|nr:hypothetical protein SEA_LIFES_100 [Microbacterium phage Lifes]
MKNLRLGACASGLWCVCWTYQLTTTKGSNMAEAKYTTGELLDAAEAFIAANAKMIEIGEGIGGLAVHDRDSFNDWSRWDNMSDEMHADTVLALLNEISRLKREINLRNRYIDELKMGLLLDD